MRRAAAKVLSRADLGALTPGGSVNNTVRDISSGNPFLEPVRAKTYDLSFEWYPQQGALVSLGLFARDIGSFIQTIRETVPFSATGLPESVLAGTTTTTADLFNFSRAVTTEGGDLKGFEVNYQQPLTFLPASRRSTSRTSRRASTWIPGAMTRCSIPTSGARSRWERRIACRRCNESDDHSSILFRDACAGVDGASSGAAD